MEEKEVDAQQLIEELRAAAAQAGAVALARDKERIQSDMAEKYDQLALRLQILRLKKARFQRIYDRLNMAIIIISSVAALVETVKGELQLNDKRATPSGWYHFLQLLPAATSAVTGFIAALVKFRKYAERLEAIGRTMERTISCMSRQTKIRDAVSSTQSRPDLDALSGTMAEVAEEVAGTLTAMAAVLKLADIVLHMPRYHALTLDYLHAEQEFQRRTQGLLRDGHFQVPDGPTLRRVPPAQIEQTLERRWSSAVFRCLRCRWRT